MVVEDVQGALALAALGGDAGADHLREAVDVAGVDPAPRYLELRPQPLRPRLGAEDAEAERDPVAEPLGGGALGEQERERGRAGEAGGAEVGQELHLQPGVAAGRRDDGGADALAAV